MLPLRSRVRQAAHVRQIVLQQSPIDRLRPRVEPLPGPPLEMRDVHQRAVCRGRPDPLARHPHPGDLLDHLTKPPSLDQGEVHPHRDPAVTGAELLIHLAHPHVRVTVIKPELRSAEPVNDPTHERHLAPIAKLLRGSARRSTRAPSSHRPAQDAAADRTTGRRPARPRGDRRASTEGRSAARPRATRRPQAGRTGDGGAGRAAARRRPATTCTSRGPWSR